ncbi:Hypothetical predicted protein [Olea europaea subsp. europaea]|uniref:Uncharacterized protein n=1 Tax=Olea europaea subsp. europaea TaxID=158383 RepID=A0A8S0S673_OLEEU|nr:Hypothetical predicted protein [Olea europaea subsp. europaea]
MRSSQHLNREHSFGVDGVFEIEGNNHEEVEREIDGGDIMEENGAWDAVREFEARSAVMETVAGGIESEAKMREIGREAVAGGIEMEAEAAGAVIETVLGNIEREMDAVDNDVGIDERTRMYTKVFTRKKRNSDRTYQQTDILMRDKRLKKASKLVSSPYTTGAKWRRHVDSMSVDLFRDVDQIKKKHFSKWHSSLGDGHWLAVEVDFCKATICMYDHDKGCITNDQLKDDLKAASVIVPLLLKEINIDLKTDTLAIEKSTKTTKQAIS